jgi:hypothetical protein
LFDTLDNLRCNLASRRLDAETILAENESSVIDVFLIRHPLKVLNAVVEFIAVLVVNLLVSFVTEKRLGNQAMDKKRPRPLWA